MSTHRYNSADAAAVVAVAARGPHGLTMHNLPDNVLVTCLFDRNEERRGTCQWGVIAMDSRTLRLVLADLTAALDRAGVTYDPPEVAGRICYLEDYGPWPTGAG